ncbi:MAG: bifunctional riboflavin kinase/FAD synthetase [Chloroflexota bacterium]
MLLEEELARFSPRQETLLTIGVFDGVHLGHKHLIARLIKQARSERCLAGVVTFRQHPQDFFSPGTRLPFLTDLTERTALLEEAGVDLIVPLSFNAELTRLSAREFLTRLQKHLKMRGLVLGPDFALGKDREGDVTALRRLGEEMGFSVSAVAPLTAGADIVSSTAIREAIIIGDVEKAERLMGRPFNLHGTVVSGTHRGQQLGFPTANLKLNHEQALPTDGVYAGWAYVNDKRYPAMANIGKNPTFNGRVRTAEVHLLDFHGDLYGSELKVDLVKYLRGEKKFDTAEELKQQITDDIVMGRAALGCRTG